MGGDYFTHIRDVGQVFDAPSASTKLRIVARWHRMQEFKDGRRISKDRWGYHWRWSRAGPSVPSSLASARCPTFRLCARDHADSLTGSGGHRINVTRHVRAGPSEGLIGGRR
jgi:hypothetical protein